MNFFSELDSVVGSVRDRVVDRGIVGSDNRSFVDVFDLTSVNEQTYKQTEKEDSLALTKVYTRDLRLPNSRGKVETLESVQGIGETRSPGERGILPLS